MKYYMVIGYKKGEKNKTLTRRMGETEADFEKRRTYQEDWIELVERDDDYATGDRPGLTWIDIEFGEPYMWEWATETQQGSLIDRHRIAREADFGIFGYVFVRKDSETFQNSIKRIQYPDSISISFDKALDQNNIEDRLPHNDDNRVDIKIPKPHDQLFSCYEKRCTIDPKVFQLTTFDNYGNGYLDLQNPSDYETFKKNLSAFIQFLQDYPNSSLYLVCSKDNEAEVRQLLRTTIKDKHLTNYFEFRDKNFVRRSSYIEERGMLQSGVPYSEYDTFPETINEFFDNKYFREKNFYHIPFKEASIEVDQKKWDVVYTKSEKFKNFLKHNPELTLTIYGDIDANTIVEFIRANGIIATIILNKDPNNALIAETIARNRSAKPEFQAILQKYGYDKLSTVEEQAEKPEVRLSFQKHLAQQLGLATVQAQDQNMQMGQNQNQNESEAQHVFKPSDSHYEPVEYHISSRFSIPDVAFNAAKEQVDLIQSLTGLTFEADPEAPDAIPPNAPQIDASMQSLFETMQAVINKSKGSKACYCPLSYSVKELLPGAFYVEKNTAEICPADFDKTKNTVFFSPAYASIAVKKDNYAYKPFKRPVDKTGLDELSELPKNAFVEALLKDCPQPSQSDLTLLLKKLHRKRSDLGLDIFARAMFSLQQKNKEAYDTLLKHYILTSKDLTELLDTPQFSEAINNLANLKDKKKIDWWNKILEIQCKTNPDFDLLHLFQQFMNFWNDLDKLQKFLPIPDFPFNDFADAGLTLGKLFRIMTRARNRFDQIQAFEGGNISHAYMLYDMFDASMYASEMDAYSKILTQKLHAENAFDKSPLKERFFSLAELSRLTRDKTVNLDQLKSYLWIFAAVNGNSLEPNSSDVSFYRKLFAAIDTAINTLPKEMQKNEDLKKKIYSSIMMFAAYGNNTSIEDSVVDIESFVGHTNLSELCDELFGLFVGESEATSKFFVAQKNGKMENAEAMPSFHTISKLYYHQDNPGNLLNLSRQWIVNNKFLSPVLQKILREPTLNKKAISEGKLDAGYLAAEKPKNKSREYIQSSFLMAVALGYGKNDEATFKQFYNEITASRLNEAQLCFLNQLLLDVNCSEEVQDFPLKDCQLFKDGKQFNSFLNKARSLTTLDELIYLIRDDFKLPLATISPSLAAKKAKIDTLNKAQELPNLLGYLTAYKEYILALLPDSTKHFKTVFVPKITGTTRENIKTTFETLKNIKDTLHESELLKITAVLQHINIGLGDKEVNPMYLLQVTDLLIKQIYPIEIIADFLDSIPKKPERILNDKLNFLTKILKKVENEPACFEDASKKKMSKQTVKQIKATLELLKAVDSVDPLTSDDDIQNYLSFLEIIASPDNITSQAVKQFSVLNAKWSELRKSGVAVNDLLDIARFDAKLLLDMNFAKYIPQIPLMAKICRNEVLLNSRKKESLDPKYKEKFATDLKSLVATATKVDLNRFYNDSQLAQPSAEVLVKLLDVYKNNVEKAQHHFEKDPGLKRPHKKKGIHVEAVTEKVLEYRKTSFNMERQDAAIKAIIEPEGDPKKYTGVEKSARRNLLYKFSIYINELGYSLPAFSHKDNDGKTSLVPLRKLSDKELKTEFNTLKTELETLRTALKDNIWQNKRYQRAVCKLLALIREAMFRFGDKNAYSTQMDAIILAVLAGDYSYAMQINTGEGKALISTSIAIAMKAITGKQVVITTSNIGLASRDAETFDPFIHWFGFSHATIKSTTSERTKVKPELTDIIHTTGSDFVLCHGKDIPIDNSQRIYLNDEYDYTMSHLTPAINSQSQPNEVDNWWIYEEVLDYVKDIVENRKPEATEKSSLQQAQLLIAALKTKFSAKSHEIQGKRAQALHAIQSNIKLTDEQKAKEKQAVEDKFNPELLDLQKKLEKLEIAGLDKKFNTLIDSAVIALYVFTEGVGYDVIPYVEEGKKYHKVVPVEGGKPIKDGDVMYMYGIHQALIVKTIKEYSKDKPTDKTPFVQPPALESTTYFNNYSTQVGAKSLGLSGTVPQRKYQMYAALLGTGRSDVIPPHKDSLRKDAVRYDALESMQVGSKHVCSAPKQAPLSMDASFQDLKTQRLKQEEAALISKLEKEISNHEGPVLIYCRDKNQCLEREQALKAKFGEGSVQTIIAGVTEDFNDGEKLTESGRKAQQPKMVTLTVGDGRGIDLTPELTKDKKQAGLLTICSFLPETAEKLFQIYGRSGRNGILGFTNFFILESELSAYGHTFNNVEEQFKFYDIIRKKEFEFAIQKIGYLQFAIQQKIKDDEPKRIQMIADMDDLYNRLLLNAVVKKIIKEKVSTDYKMEDGKPALSFTGRWEPFVTLSDTDLDLIYTQFCDETQKLLQKLNLENLINIKEIQQNQEKSPKSARTAILQEETALKAPSSAYVQDRIEHAVQRSKAKLIPDRDENSQAFKSNSVRFDKTLSLMEKFLDNHLGIYGLGSDQVLTNEYQELYQIFITHKNKLNTVKEEYRSAFHTVLVAESCVKILDLIKADIHAKSKSNLTNIQSAFLKMEQDILHYKGQNPLIEQTRQQVLNYCEKPVNDLEEASISDLQQALRESIKQFRETNSNTEASILAVCTNSYETFVQEMNQKKSKQIETLASGTMKKEESELRTLFSLVQMTTKKERRSAPVKTMAAGLSTKINPTMESYNKKVKELQDLLAQNFQYQSYLGEDATHTKDRLSQHEPYALFSEAASNMVVFYNHFQSAPKDLIKVNKKITEETEKNASLKEKVAAKAEELSSAYEKAFDSYKQVINEQRLYESLLGKASVDKLTKYPSEPLLDGSNIKQLRELEFSLAALKEDIVKEQEISKSLQEEVAKENTEPYNRFKTAIDVLQEKIKSFKTTNPLAHKAAKRVHQRLSEAGTAYFSKPCTVTSYEAFNKACKVAIHDKDDRRVLNKHRGWAKFLGNILAIILTAGIGYAIAAGINIKLKGKFTFFSTDSSLKLDEIEKHVKSVPKPR